MREMLESFRLPGEAQQIERITDTFAAKYFGSEPGMLRFTALEIALLIHFSS
jgi:golgi-specific brefeldin A-resistance guanine nucleotide exchange factor 1